MSLIVTLYYTGKDGAARKFAREMLDGGTVAAIRNEPGNLRYDYYFSLEDEETLLLIDSWENQTALDAHHASPMMQTILDLREKYGLQVCAERFFSDPQGVPAGDQKFLSEPTFPK